MRDAKTTAQFALWWIGRIMLSFAPIGYVIGIAVGIQFGKKRWGRA